MRYAFKYIIIFLSLYGFFSCTTEEDPGTTPPEGEDVVTVYFNSVGPATYALDFEKESEVKTIDFLAFKIDGSTMLYADRKQIDDSDMTTTGLDENTGLYRRSFEVELTTDGGQYMYVLLANARAEVTACLNKYPDVVEMHAMLSHIVASNTGVWDTGTNYKTIPMWGEYGPATPQTLDGKVIELVRSVARVDISVSAGDFTLSEVYIKNQYNHGKVVPLASNWDISKKKVTGPSVPLTGDYTGQLINTNPLKYAPAPSTGGEISSNSLVRSIYLFETELPSNNNFMNTVHLILKGTKIGYGTTYYRADFKDFFTNTAEENNNTWQEGPPGTGSGSGGFVGAGDPYRKLLRNHHYQMNIVSVAGAGYSSIDQASSNLNSQHMMVEYINWNDQGNPVNIGNTTYSFDISRAKVNFNTGFVEDFIVVKTNYPGEWKVDKPSETDWFSCEKKVNGVNVLFTGDKTVSHTGHFNILLMNNNEIKFTYKIQVSYTP